MAAPQVARGVYIERAIAGTVRILAVTGSGRVPIATIVDRDFYDPDIVTGLQRWLDRVDPIPSLTLIP